MTLLLTWFNIVQSHLNFLRYCKHPDFWFTTSLSDKISPVPGPLKATGFQALRQQVNSYLKMPGFICRKKEKPFFFYFKHEKSGKNKEVGLRREKERCQKRDGKRMLSPMYLYEEHGTMTDRMNTVSSKGLQIETSPSKYSNSNSSLMSLN